MEDFYDKTTIFETFKSIRISWLNMYGDRNYQLRQLTKCRPNIKIPIQDGLDEYGQSTGRFKDTG